MHTYPNAVGVKQSTPQSRQNENENENVCALELKGDNEFSLPIKSKIPMKIWIDIRITQNNYPRPI